ncbi:MAG: hypothetical protein U0975_16215 [Erythrobacter sp.]|nr:hypothetical protein [Erythrobacter sp.]MDZ4274206.1 hypothetical protein [Erythrobacter sp.]
MNEDARARLLVAGLTLFALAVIGGLLAQAPAPPAPTLQPERNPQ